MTLLIFLLILSVLGFLGVLYAVNDAWRGYRVASYSNGWVKLAARELLRSQIIRLIEGGLLVGTISTAMLRDNMTDPPMWLEALPRITIIMVVCLISVNAVLDAFASKKVLEY